jgi:hypothetical protein
MVWKGTWLTAKNSLSQKKLRTKTVIQARSLSKGSPRAHTPLITFINKYINYIK